MSAYTRSACTSRRMARRALYSQAMTRPTVGGLYLMPHAHPRRAPRRVVLESVPRRDAAHRLSLAFTLLARRVLEPSRSLGSPGAADRHAGPPARSFDGEGR